MRSTHRLLWLTPVLAALVGCAGGSGVPPTLPPGTTTGSGAAEAVLNVKPHADSLMLASVDLRLDPATGNVQVDPTRLNQAVGDAYLVGLNALAPKCFSLRSVKKASLPNGDVLLTLGLAFKHPFPLATRPDLFGWDLKAILASNLSPITFSGAGVTLEHQAYSPFVGASTEMSNEIAAQDPTLTSNVFPYIILGEDRGTPTPFDYTNPTGWNVFPSGSTASGDMNIELPPSTVVKAHLYFVVGYQASATRDTRLSPSYQPPRGNARAAWRVDATATADTLTQTLGSLATVQINIWDWQQGQGLGSDVDTIKVWAPDMMSAPLDVPVGTGTGRGADPVSAQATIINQLGTFTGTETWALVEVRDQLYHNNPGGAAGQAGVTVIEDDLHTVDTYDDFRTFQVVHLTVANNDTPPVPVLSTTPPLSGGALSISSGTTVQFDGSASHDPDAPAHPQGDILLYEYDYEWDGINADFSADESHPTAVTTSHAYLSPETTTMGFAVTDGVGVRTILAVPVTVNPVSPMSLNLDPIQDIISNPDSYDEKGATLTQAADGTIVMIYDAVHFGGGGRSCPGYRSTYGGGAFSVGNDVTGAGYPYVLSYVEAGYYLKAFTNWQNPSNNTLYQLFFTDYNTHEANQVSNGLDFDIGYAAPDPSGPAGCIGFCGYNEYSDDFAISRTTGTIIAFTEKPTSGTFTPNLIAWQGGPDWCTPGVVWQGTVPTFTIDARPSEISHWRSTGTDAAGGIHIAYRAQDGSYVSYARSTTGNVADFTQTDLSTGAAGQFKDPTIDVDDTEGLHVVDAEFTGTKYLLDEWTSTDNGLTWSPKSNFGASLVSEPTDLAVSARKIAGHDVIAVGYIVDGQQWVRYSVDNGSSWTDLALSNGPSDYSGEILIDRATDDFYAVYSQNIAGASKVQARHGTFS